MKNTLLAAAVLVLALPLAAGRAGAQTTRHQVDRVVATVGSEPILWSDVLETFAARRAAGMTVPQDSAAQMALARQILDELIDVELMVQRARELAVEVPEDRIREQVDRRITQIRQQFPTEDAFRQALNEAGFATIEEYRRMSMESGRREALQQGLVMQLRRDKKLPAVTVSDEEISRAFAQYRPMLEQQPATITFRQIVIPPQATAEAKAVAKAKADSLLAQLRAGADFEQLARRESMDSVSAQLGGDIGWWRRGGLLPAYEYWLFTLQPGQLSPVFETSYGYHIIRVDRVQPAERKSRQILIRPRIDSTAIRNTRQLADSVARLWRNGAPFDSLVTEFHDMIELRGIFDPAPIDSLPPEYRQALATGEEGQIVPPFQIGNPDAPKFAIAEVLTRRDAGEFSEAEARQLIRERLAQEKAIRKWLDELRSRTYVSVRM